jgi:hypothetical protein
MSDSSNFNVIVWQCNAAQMKKGLNTMTFETKTFVNKSDKNIAAIQIKWRCKSNYDGITVLNFISEDTFTIEGIKDLSIDRLKETVLVSYKRVIDEFEYRTNLSWHLYFQSKISDEAIFEMHKTLL